MKGTVKKLITGKFLDIFLHTSESFGKDNSHPINHWTSFDTCLSLMAYQEEYFDPILFCTHLNSEQSLFSKDTSPHQFGERFCKGWNSDLTCLFEHWSFKTIKLPTSCLNEGLLVSLSRNPLWHSHQTSGNKKVVI